MSTLPQDLRHSVRLLLKTPGFSATAVLVLALGIGANAAIFTLVNTLLLKPLPGSEQPGQVVGIYSRDHTRPDSYRGFSYPAYTDIRDRANSFSDVAAFTLAFVGVGEADSTRRVFAAVATRGYFSTLGVNLRMGRTFTEDEERPGSNAQVAMVSDRYWKSQGGDPALLGKTVQINTRPFTIVGIAPPGFTGTSSLAAPEAWVPTGGPRAGRQRLHERDRPRLARRPPQRPPHAHRPAAAWSHRGGRGALAAGALRTAREGLPGREQEPASERQPAVAHLDLPPARRTTPTSSRPSPS